MDREPLRRHGFLCVTIHNEDTEMTDTKKTATDTGRTKSKKKLQVNKETLKDLGSLKDKAAAVKGGRACCGGDTFTRGE